MSSFHCLYIDVFNEKWFFDIKILTSNTVDAVDVLWFLCVVFEHFHWRILWKVVFWQWNFDVEYGCYSMWFL